MFLIGVFKLFLIVDMGGEGNVGVDGRMIINIGF